MKTLKKLLVITISCLGISQAQASSLPGFINQAGSSIPQYNTAQQSVVSIAGQMNGSWVGGDNQASFDCFGPFYAGKCNAYIQAGQYAKVVEFQISGNQITALSAKYRAGPYDRSALDYVSAPLATDNTAPGYGLKNLNFNFGVTFTQARDYLPSQNQLQEQLNTPVFINSLFGKAAWSSLDLSDGFWIGNLDLPTNLGIASGSSLRVKTSAGYNVTYKNSFVLKRGVAYVFSYNTKGKWDIGREIGFQAFVSPSGVDVSDVSSLGQPSMLWANLNGSWMGGARSAEVKNLGNGNFDVYRSEGAYTKVVSLQVLNGVIKTTGAKYRAGSYATTASDYIPAPVASSNSDAGYGVQNVILQYSGN